MRDLNNPPTLNLTTPLDLAACRERLNARDLPDGWRLKWETGRRFVLVNQLKTIQQFDLEDYVDRIELVGQLTPAENGTEVKAFIESKLLAELNDESRSYLIVVVVVLLVIIVVFFLVREWVGLVVAAAFLIYLVYSYFKHQPEQQQMLDDMLAWVRDALGQ